MTEQEFEEFIGTPSFGWKMCRQCGAQYLPGDNHKCPPNKRKFAPIPKHVKTLSQVKTSPPKTTFRIHSPIS